MVSDGVRTYSYDNAGRSSTISQNSIIMANLYDGLGQRVRKSASNVPTNFMYDEQGHLLGEYDQNNAMIREYIWLGDRIIGMYSKDAPNILLRVHTDHLGTPRAVTMEDGSSRRVLWRFEGDAFGDVQPINPTSATFIMPLRMAGQYFDSEVGTSYNYFRDYNPSTGRYVESDPIGLEGGLNTYGYVGGKTITRVDRYGLAPGMVEPEVNEAAQNLPDATPSSMSNHDDPKNRACHAAFGANQICPGDPPLVPNVPLPRLHNPNDNCIDIFTPGKCSGAPKPDPFKHPNLPDPGPDGHWECPTSTVRKLIN